MLAIYALSDEELLRQCSQRKGKAQGPGGQHRHAHASAITLMHESSGVTAGASDARSAAVNLTKALKTLRLRLAMHIRGASDRTLLNKYTHNKKFKINPSNTEFASVVAVVLDELTEMNYDIAETARRLEMSTSQLIKSLIVEKELWSFVQEQRQERGLSPLKTPR